MPRAERSRSLRGGFIEKTLQAIAEFMHNEVFAEHLARESGLMQAIDPRAKLLTVLFLILMAGLFRHGFPLVMLNLWVLWLARSSRVPLGLFARRVWIVVPLFTGIVVLPSIFNVIRPGTPILTLFHLAHPMKFGYLTIPAAVAVTREGLAAAMLLMLRVGASVSLAVLLTLTTRWNVLLKALRVLRIPMIFIAVLDMSYRYIFLLLHTSSDMFMARKSRLAGRVRSREQRRFVASAMGNLWGKTAALSEEVHGAMLARGYAGAPKSISRFAMKKSDWLWLGLVLVVAGLLMGSDLVLA
jgi:cobalt/nickel transport system permease protein